MVLPSMIDGGTSVFRTSPSTLTLMSDSAARAVRIAGPGNISSTESKTARAFVFIKLPPFKKYKICAK